MAKNNESDVTTTAAEAPKPTEPVAAHSRGTGLRTAAVAVGAVLSAGLLFGGGVALGVALPDGGPRPSFGAAHDEQRSGGGLPQGGPQQNGPQDGSRQGGPQFGGPRPGGPGLGGPDRGEQAPDSETGGDADSETDEG